MHNPHPILDRVEQSFNAVAALLLESDTEALVAACSDLQQLSVALAQWISLHGLGAQDQQFKLRVSHLAQGMQTLRDNLARRAAFVDQSLTILFPARPGPTYSASGAAPTRGLQRPRGFMG